MAMRLYATAMRLLLGLSCWSMPSIMGGASLRLLAAVSFALATTSASAATEYWFGTLSGLYSTANESGQGHFINQQGSDGEELYGTSFVYGPDSKPLWLVYYAYYWGDWEGTVYTATGPPFSAFDPSKAVPVPAGMVYINASPGALDLFFDLDASIFGTKITIAKHVTRQVFSNLLPICRPATPEEQAAATNFQDLWWAYPAGSESGWGLSIAHQGDVLFVGWFTYGADGKPLWMVFAATKTRPNVYSGNVYTATGPSFAAATYDPSAVVGTQVGTATLTFANGNRGTFAYTVYGVSQSKEITRQLFSDVGNMCE